MISIINILILRLLFLVLLGAYAVFLYKIFKLWRCHVANIGYWWDGSNWRMVSFLKFYRKFNKVFRDEQGYYSEWWQSPTSKEAGYWDPSSNSMVIFDTCVIGFYGEGILLSLANLELAYIYVHYIRFFGRKRKGDETVGK